MREHRKRKKNSKAAAAAAAATIVKHSIRYLFVLHRSLRPRILRGTREPGQSEQTTHTSKDERGRERGGKVREKDEIWLQR
mgnify:CR=1 FL=1